jgi:hypothetical protein
MPDPLATLAAERRANDTRATSSATRLRDAVRAEHAAGVGVVELAARTGYSRETIRKMLKTQSSQQQSSSQTSA